jgi:hypothetical protein
MYRWRIGYGSRPAPALIPLAVLVLAGSLLFVLASQQPRVGEAGARVGGVGHGAISHGAIGHVAIQPRAGGTGGRDGVRREWLRWACRREPATGAPERG